MAISTLSLKDRALLSAEVKKFDAEYDCSTKSTEMEHKLNQYIERKAPQHIIDHMRKEMQDAKYRMCELDNKAIVSGGFIFKKCLCNYNYNGFSYLFSIYKAYKAGFLPFKGAYTEQPNQIIEIIQLIDSVYNEVIDEVNRRNNG